MAEYSPSIAKITMPDSIRRLPVCPVRRMPVPWFVAFIDGKPEFRAIAPGKIREAVERRLCWVCGERRTSVSSFVIGPMCSINRISAEPPSHPECACFSAVACPFLSKPGMVRRENDMPTGTKDLPGVALLHNPGVTAIWNCRWFQPFRVPTGGVLFEIGEPSGRVEWYTEGRLANRAEVEAAVARGYPKLLEAAGGTEASADELASLESNRKRAMIYWPTR